MPTVTVVQFDEGLNTRLSPFNIPDDSFSTLVNAYTYRGTVVKKPGTTLICRPVRAFSSTDWVTLSASGAGSFNAITIAEGAATASIQIGSVSLSDGTNTYTEPSTPDGTLVSSGTASGTINYATGDVTITGGAANQPITGTVGIFYGLPIMGIFPFALQLGFGSSETVQFILDQSFAYNYVSGSNYGTATFNSYFYSSGNVCQWHGESWQLFDSEDFSNACWVSNGVAGMQFKLITGITVGSTTTVTIANHGLLVNDYVWFNEIQGTTQLNGLTGLVTSVIDSNSFVVNINSTGFAAYTTGGIAQYLTSSAANPDADGIRYYINGGFVNYAPPYIAFSTASGAAPVRYICGANIILAFKSRLIFFGVYTTSSSGDIVFDGGSIVYSSLGSPFYTSLVPQNGQSSAGAFYFAPVGVYGGFISLNANENISSASLWLESVLIDFQSFKIRLLSTPSATAPFLYEYISSEYGGLNKTSALPFNNGTIGISPRGFLITNTAGCLRIDDDVPDIIYSISLQNNAYSRVIMQRDYQRELVYFTFPNARNTNLFPDTSLVYNYHDNTWAQFFESFCCYGPLLNTTSVTWASLTSPWYTYTQTWNSFGLGQQNLYYVGGNQQGFVLERDSQSGTAAANSLTIAAINGDTLTVENHNLEAGAVIAISGCIGVTSLNNSSYIVQSILGTSQFTINATASAGTYLGGGLIAVQDNFIIGTKAFNFGFPNAKTISVNTVRSMTNLNPEGVGDYSILSFANMDTSQPVNISTPSYSPLLLGSMSTAPDASTGFNEEQEMQQYVWKRTSVNTAGFTVQFLFTMTPTQMLVQTNTNAPFQLQGFSFDYELGREMGA